MPLFRPVRARRAATLVFVAITVGLTGAACSTATNDGNGAGSGSSGCEQPTPEAIDPQSVLHVLPNAPEPSYRTDPPSSGPHLMGPDLHGALDQPLSRPIQVGVLEGGQVLAQYPSSDAATKEALLPLASDRLVVAPNPGIDGVVVTAWGWRMTCATVDGAAVERFAAEHGDATSHMSGG